MSFFLLYVWMKNSRYVFLEFDSILRWRMIFSETFWVFRWLFSFWKDVNPLHQRPSPSRSRSKALVTKPWWWENFWSAPENHENSIPDIFYGNPFSWKSCYVISQSWEYKKSRKHEHLVENKNSKSSVRGKRYHGFFCTPTSRTGNSMNFVR